jgi:glycine/D-amino acid oxidase-like deaminating enzyme
VAGTGAPRPGLRRKLVGAWAGYYDYNVFDQNAIVGPAPGLDNFILANGFSGHGLQQAPAVGRAIAEWITAGHYLSLDLSPLGYERIPNGRPLREDNII